MKATLPWKPSDPEEVTFPTTDPMLASCRQPRLPIGWLIRCIDVGAPLATAASTGSIRGR